ncbi:MAG: CaiB/BaiF CoA transferase family protein [Dehalococcoidia bacterium]
MPGVFEGFTVVELADRRNQFVGKLFAESGARVIQVEPIAGSPARWTGPFVDDQPDADRCLDYWFYNTGKDSVCIDITRAPGQELLRRILATADVFVESTRPGTLAALGLDYASVSKDHDALIYLSLTDFGQAGPWVDYEMNDHAHLASGGVMGSSGYSDPKETPIGGQRNHAFSMASIVATHTVTAALWERAASGLGQYLDVAIHDVVAVSTEAAVPQWLWYNQPLLRQTGQHARPTVGRPAAMPTADGKFIQGSNAQFNDRNWPQFVAWLKEVGVGEDLWDEKWNDATYRGANLRAVIDPVLEALCEKVPADEAFVRGQTVGIPWTVIRAPEENLAFKHFQERGYWAEVEQPEIGKAVTFPRALFSSDELGSRPARRAPHLGEHTRAILAEVGVDEATVAAYLQTGVVHAAAQSSPATPKPAPARIDVRPTFAKERTAHTPTLPQNFLNGTRIIDLSWKTVGPVSARMLTPYGAEVIHIEPPLRPDDHRFHATPTKGPSTDGRQEWKGRPWRADSNATPYYSDPYWNSLHSGKLAVNLNTRHPEGMKLFQELLKQSDALTENFSGGVLTSWKMGWEQLQELNPRLVYHSTSGFGHRGEWGGFRSYGQIAQGASGLTFTSGLPGKMPAGWGYSYMDVTGGWCGGLGLLMGLLQAKRTGKGVRVDYAVTEAGMALLGPYFLDYQVNGRPTRRSGFPPGNHTEWPAVAPHNTYRCAGIDRQGQDWWVFIAAQTQPQFEALCGVMGKPELLSDPRFATNEARVANQDVLDDIISTWTAPRRRYEIQTVLQAAGVIAVAVQGAEDRVEYDDQLRSRELYPVIAAPEVGEVEIERFVPRMSRTPGAAAFRAPQLREHTEYVYGDLLGLSSARMQELEREGVI